MKLKNYLLLLLIAILFAGCGKKEYEVIKIGAILPLTGDNAVYGQSLKKGMEIALDEISNKTLNIIYEDDQALPNKGVNAFNKLVEYDKVKLVIGAMFSAVTLAIAPIAESKKIVLISPTSSAINLTNAGDYIFRIYPSDSYDGKFLAKFTIDKLKAKKVAIVYLQVSSTVAISNEYKDLIEKNGAQVVLFEGYKEGEKDFKSIISKIKQASPDLVFIPGYIKEMAQFIKQTKEQKLRTQMLSISTFNDPKIFELVGEAAEGIIFSSPIFDAQNKDSLTTNFTDRFEKKYNTIPDIWAGYGYDVLRLANFVIHDKSTVQEIKNKLYEIKNFPGVTGNITFDENGDVTKDLKIFQVINNQFIPYE